jgi:hypothetical protein
MTSAGEGAVVVLIYTLLNASPRRTLKNAYTECTE